MKLNENYLREILRTISEGNGSAENIAVSTGLDRSLVNVYMGFLDKHGYIKGAKGCPFDVGEQEYTEAVSTDQGKVAIADLNNWVFQEESSSTNYDLRDARFGGGFAAKDGIQIGGIQHNYATPEKQSLADAALEIQRLLKQLEETNPTATEAEQKAFVTAAIPANLRQRAVGALQSGGRAAVEELLDNPYVNIALAVIEGWRMADG